MTTFAPDTTFGKYRIIRLLGQGGMADVYEAEDTSIGRRVALKILPLAFARDEERARRFAKEIQASAALDHPNIVSVFEVGEIDDLHYYTMSVLPGGDLKARLKTGALSQKEALRITREIASALNYAHDKGFVHRDVKPENILFREDGSAVLTDFGIARATSSQTRMTATGLSIGTPHYMSPEQARGKEVDGRSDLYALGVVFHEMLTGKVPFDAQDSFAVGLMHINDAPPELPPRLGRFQPILDQLLAKEPDDRYQSGAQLVADLDRLEKGEAIEPPRRATRMIKRTDHGITESRNLGRKADHGESRAGGSRSGLYWALGGATLALVLAAGIYLWQDQSSSLPPIGGGSTTASRSAPAESASATPQPGNRNPQPVSSGRAPSEPALSNRDLTGNAILHIETTPEGAEVFLNDEAIGTTPFQSDNLPAGEHRLRLAHRYYEPWEQTVRLEDDVVDRIEAELQRGRGRVTVITDPPGAEVWIDGKPQAGKTPLTIANIEAGEWPLEVRLSRHRTEMRTIKIKSNDTTRLNLVLQGGNLYERNGRWLDRKEYIHAMLAEAQDNLRVDRLMRPDGNNAFDLYVDIISIDAENRQARKGIANIARRYAELAAGTLENGRISQAEEYRRNIERTGEYLEQPPFKNTLISGGLHERIISLAEHALEQEEWQRLDSFIKYSELFGVSPNRVTEMKERLGKHLLAHVNIQGWTRSRISARQQAVAEHLKMSSVFKDCPQCPEMIVIPPGVLSRNRRSEEGSKGIEISTFAIGRAEITFNNWQPCVIAGACNELDEDEGWGRDNRPVINVPWSQVIAYTEWLSSITDEKYRLPNDAEWEYAARAGSDSEFVVGECISARDANFDGRYPPPGCQKTDRLAQTRSVASYSGNEFGLHDVHGNVREWVINCWGNYRLENENFLSTPNACEGGTTRGGSWFSGYRGLRLSSRKRTERSERGGDDIGIRIVREISYQ